MTVVIKKDDILEKFHELMVSLDEFIGIADLEEAVNDCQKFQYPPKIGRWVKVTGNFATPGGTPLFVCEKCGGDQHLYGVEFPRRKVFCSKCETVNLYPWEGCLEEMEEHDENND